MEAARSELDRPTFSPGDAARLHADQGSLTDTRRAVLGDFPIRPDIVAALADHGITCVPNQR